MNELASGAFVADLQRAEPPVVALVAASAPACSTRQHAAVHALDIAVAPGEIVAVVGSAESGAATLARVLAGLAPLAGGARHWRGHDVATLARAEQRRSRIEVQMVFRDQDCALDPHSRVLEIVGEAPRVHGLIRRTQQVEYVGLQLNRVGLDPMLMRRFPDEFTAAQRVRIGIARALAVRPACLVCDDVLGGADVSVQAQIVNLLMDVRASLGIAIVLATRELPAALHVADRLAVMHSGRLLEIGRANDVAAAPAHPYTRALLAAMRGLTASAGKQPHWRSADAARGAGCALQACCPQVNKGCRDRAPAMVDVGPLHAAACHLASAGA